MRFRAGAVVALLALPGVARAESSAGSAAWSCWQLPIATFPLAGDVVPRNATVTLFSGYPGLYELTANDYSETFRADSSDALRTVHFGPSRLLPPRTSVALRYEGGVLVSFTTSDAQDTTPPPAPKLGEVRAALALGIREVGIPVEASADTVALSLTTENRTTKQSSTMRIPRAGLTGSVPADCPGFQFGYAQEVCFHVRALDLADNASPEVVSCVVTGEASPPPPPSFRPHGESPDEIAARTYVPPSPRTPILVWSAVAALLVLASLVRRYRVGRRRSATTTPLQTEPIRASARVLRSGGLALLVLAGIGVCAGIVFGSTASEAAWYAGVPGALLPLALVHVVRGQRILALLRDGAVATTDGKGHVFIVRDGRLRSWLVGTTSALSRAELRRD
ncbi:MAG: hypothetical protein IPQ07_27410 [Myxococcales bacterium]|nr:hypothetical protein [Myxococcales bacterium]